MGNWMSSSKVTIRWRCPFKLPLLEVPQRRNAENPKLPLPQISRSPDLPTPEFAEGRGAVDLQEPRQHRPQACSQPPQRAELCFCPSFPFICAPLRVIISSSSFFLGGRSLLFICFVLCAFCCLVWELSGGRRKPPNYRSHLYIAWVLAPKKGPCLVVD